MTTWKCKHKCDVSRRICEHLEKELPSMEQGAFIKNSETPNQYQRLFYLDDLGQFSGTAPDSHSQTLLEFERVLDRYDLTALERKVMKHRFFYNETFRDIAKSLNMGVRQVHTVYQQVLKRYYKEAHE